MNRNDGFFSNNWWRFLFLPLIIPAVIALAIYWLFPSAKKARNRTPQEVAKVLRGFIAGTGGEWDWDDFTSTPITNPDLDAIRQEADAVPLPVDDAGLATLRALLDRVTSLPA